MTAHRVAVRESVLLKITEYILSLLLIFEGKEMVFLLKPSVRPDEAKVNWLPV